MSDRLHTLKYLNGTQFCMVFMEVVDQAAQKVKLTPVHGTARITADRLLVEEHDGTQVTVPDSALPSILPSDGNEMLGDADHYVIVRMSGS